VASRAAIEEMPPDLRERRPRREVVRWRFQGRAPSDVVPLPGMGAYYVHEYGRAFVVSALELADYPDGSGVRGPQWHLSISGRGKHGRVERPDEKRVRQVLRDFGLEGAEEDNHHPGHARHFWLPVDLARRVTCECKETEETIVEPDGYRWTNPTDGGCRGCELEVLIAKPCPIHKPASARAGRERSRRG
jgi:hypothetical protein